MSNTENVQEVAVSDVTRDLAYQVRSHLDDALVKQYATNMTNGAKFPPIRLAQIKGALFLVDGWHRHAAAQSLNHKTIEAIVLPMTGQEALLASALANSTHGKPLKSSEKQNAFKSFIKGRGHIRADRSLLSYREIAVTLGGHVGHTTVHGWMRKHFPSVAEAMGVDVPRGKGNGEPPPVDLEAQYRQQVEASINDAMQLYKQLTVPDNRYEIIQQVEKVLAEMKTAEHWSVGF